MKKTLYISDLDGTLLNSRSQVSDTSRALLNRLIADYDINFSIATARTPATTLQLMRGIDYRLPLIVMTGSAMWANGRLVNRHYLQAEEVDVLVDVAHRYGIRPFFYTYNGRMIEAYHLPQMSDYERDFVALRNHSPFKRFVFGNTLPADKRGVTMLAFAAAEYGLMHKAYVEARERMKREPVFYRDIFNPDVGFLEVIAADASKAAALAELRDEIGAERVVVFGDSANDLSMRRVADVFVAPANASEEVRRVADEVTASNDDDCVALWIERDVASR